VKNRTAKKNKDNNRTAKHAKHAKKIKTIIEPPRRREKQEQ